MFLEIDEIINEKLINDIPLSAMDKVNLARDARRPKIQDCIDNLFTDFFEQKGIEVLDKRSEGGRLWAIGERENIKSAVNEAIAKFKISGKYMCCKDSNNRNGWCTKTEK